MPRPTRPRPFVEYQYTLARLQRQMAVDERVPQAAKAGVGEALRVVNEYLVQNGESHDPQASSAED